MRLKTIIFIAFASLAFSVTAQEDIYRLLTDTEKNSVTTKIEQASAALTSIQSSFTQVKNISVLSETVVSKGNLLYKKSDKLCWEYVSPYYYLFALNGDKVTIKNEQTTSQFDTKSNALFKEISLLLVNSISGTGLIDPKKFDATFYENASIVKVILSPKSKTMKSFLSSISLYFDKKNYLVGSIEMNEPSGDNTVIVFSGLKLNETIGDEKFLVH
jgi:outer membrane lipoprotein carrier protein